ncbi:trypsin-like peptidase domain-containing protein [Paucibacter sp. PLA-PC-4]|uniref:S1C family serine protease n=1 Tax=Paucibacter sp. PLA-PC-4 TaxID=2993655 RepID=UPI00224B805D|nr:trypsin-like peptidase domain-containing protein [Paucibacter sp. PLA-PC-4]MCX2863380.1 trypsin-like peptidase domain-containing protein [Paucibacter sp. PLA-PC-4]
MRRIWLIFSQAVTVGLALYFVVATLRPEWVERGETLRPTVILGQAIPSARPASDASGGGGYRFAAQRAAPAVVSVTASKAPRRSAQNDEAWRRFHFGLPRRGQRGEDDGDEQGGQTGLGSGVIVSADGYLLTNSHVVAGASEIEVQLSDGRQAKARLVGSDPETDVAVLKVELDGLPAIALGDAEQLQVGDAVLAIGNPFNVGQTVTSGIVSALKRTQLGINTFENFIQTDAAINPGNSGGALVDDQGRLVGINTAIFSRSGGSLGIGFAIPISTAQQVMQALVRDGQVARGWIGVQTRELTPEFAEAFKLTVREGVLISAVVVNAPAANAGIKPGDVVTRVGGTQVLSPADLLAAVAALKPQSSAAIAVQRGDKALQFELTVAQRPLPGARD